MKSKINTNHEKKINTRGFGSSFRLHKGVMHFILPDFFSEAKNKFKFLSIKTSNWKFKNWNEKNSFKNHNILDPIRHNSKNSNYLITCQLNFSPVVLDSLL